MGVTLRVAEELAEPGERVSEARRQGLDAQVQPRELLDAPLEPGRD